MQTVETAANCRRLVMEARAYDDGVAFRYVLPEQPSMKDVRILNEATQFRFSKDANTISLISRGFQTSNEDDYHELAISGLHPEYLVNLPVLVNVPGIAWVGLTEADIENYSSLFVTAAGGTLAARLATRVEDVNTNTDIAPAFDPKADASKVSVIAQTPVRSAWRVLMIADQPGTAGGIEHGGQSESAERHRRHFVDQAGQDSLGLVERQPGEGRREPRQEQRDDEVLHRFRGAEQIRVHADRRRLGGRFCFGARAGRAVAAAHGPHQIHRGHRYADAGGVCESRRTCACGCGRISAICTTRWTMLSVNTRNGASPA